MYTCSSASNQIRCLTLTTTVVVVVQLVLVQTHFLWTPPGVVVQQEPNNHLLLQSLLSSSSKSSSNNNTTRTTQTTAADHTATNNGSIINNNNAALAASTRDLVFATDDNNNNNITQRQQQRTLQSLSNRSILFVHVGKAAGETIKNILKFGCISRRNPRRRKECLEQVPASSLSDKVGGYFHCFSVRPRQFIPQADAFLLNIRHPVDRAVSWYRYVHPAHCDLTKHDRSSPVCIAARQLRTRPAGWVSQFFGQCFPTVQAWAEAYYSNSSNNNNSNNKTNNRSIWLTTASDDTTNARTNATTILSINCTQLAEQTFQGMSFMDHKETPLAAHMIANYRHYVSQTVDQFPNKPVILVRTRALWQDLKHVDKLLGGTGDFGMAEGSAVTHGSEHFIVRGTDNDQDNNDSNNNNNTIKNGNSNGNNDDDSYLSPTATLQLCCALLDDIRTYANLIQRAVNWNDTTKQSETQFLVQRCDANLQSMNELVQHCVQ